MTTTNSYDFTVSRDNLITDALLHIGVIGEGETPSANAVTEAARLLNMMVKMRSADGMPLWALKRGYILPFTGASSIASDSHVVMSYDHTTIGADEAASQTTITVTSSSAMTAADQIGIEQDDNTVLWTTIASVDDGTTITLDDALTAAASSGNHIYSYTASSQRIQKPLRIMGASRLEQSSGATTMIEVEDREDYFAISNRTTASVPTLVYYTPESTVLTNLDNGQFFVWPRFNNGDYVIEFTYHRPFQDFDAASDNPDFPPAFYLPLMLELAALLGPRYGVPKEERNALFLESKIYRDEALTTQAPEGSMTIMPAERC